MSGPDGALGKIARVLDAHEAAGGGLTITMGQMLDGMEERAYGVVLLLLALPCCLPFIYILPQIVALPMVVLAAQLATGRTVPWLPAKLRQRSMGVAGLREVLAKAQHYGGWLEKLAHRRLALFTNALGMRVAGALLVIPCLSILVPLPLTNTVPGIGVAVASVGLIERDGLFLLGGVLIGLIWVLMLVIGGPALVYFIIDFVLQRSSQ